MLQTALATTAYPPAVPLPSPEENPEFIWVEDGIYKRTNGKYYERALINGRRTWKSLKTKNLKFAREERARRLEKGEKAYRKANLKLDEIIAQYRKDGCPDRHRQKRPKLMAEAEAANCDTLLGWWKGKAIEDVTHGACDRYADWRQDRVKDGCSGGCTIDLELNTLSNAFKWAMRLELVKYNPLAERPRYRSSTSVKHCRNFKSNDAEEMHKIAALGFAKRRSESAMWQFTFENYTGLRTIETQPPGILQCLGESETA